MDMSRAVIVGKRLSCRVGQRSLRLGNLSISDSGSMSNMFLQTRGAR